MNNNLKDLSDGLFEQFKRLNNNELTGDDLKLEICRAKAICGVSTELIKTADLSLKAHTMLNTGMSKKAPAILGVTDGKE